MMDRLRDWRNAMLGRSTVRDRLAAMPIGTWIAERHARRLFSVVTGFAQSQMLSAGVELGCFDILLAAPAPPESLAVGSSAGREALIAAIIALGLWERRSDGKIALTVDGMVVATDPGIRAMIAHHRLLYADLADPTAILANPGTGTVGAFWPYRGSGAADEYSALMAASQSFVTAALLAGYNFSRHRHVMDVGGGDGGVVRALARRHPRLALTLVDLPPVADRARDRLADSPQIRVEGRAPGQALPVGADAVTLVRLLHDLDDDAALALLRQVADALPANGRVIVAEPMRGRGHDPVAAYFAAYFAAMGSGRIRSSRDIRELLRASGLRPIRGRRHRFLLDIVVARKP